MGVRHIGPEPSGATPLDDDDFVGLIPDFVAARADLNQVEFENITKALPWAHRQARRGGLDGVLSYAFHVGPAPPDVRRRLDVGGDDS